jgi:hypothetical protein
VSPLHALAILAGIVAGTINTVVGSATPFSFPVLLAFGDAPAVANISNTIGLLPGSAAGGVGYRRELAGQGRRTIPLAAAPILGGVAGAVLLPSLPASAFESIVPIFIAIALVLITASTASTAATSARLRGSCGSRSWPSSSTRTCSGSTR